MFKEKIKALFRYTKVVYYNDQSKTSGFIEFNLAGGDNNVYLTDLHKLGRMFNTKDVTVDGWYNTAANGGCVKCNCDCVQDTSVKYVLIENIKLDKKRTKRKGG